MITLDLHTHSTFSFDGHHSVKDMLSGAVKNNINILCLTEHFDLFKNGGDDYFWRTNKDRTEAMAHYKEEFKDSCLLLDGIELGQPHVNPIEAEKVLSSNHFDFVIGSIHNLSDGTDVYTFDYRTHDQCVYVMNEYLNEVYKTALNSDYDSLGHIDFPLRKMELVRSEERRVGKEC